MNEITYKQAGTIPYKIVSDELYFLIITSRKKKNWIFPKGLIENDLSETETAIKETYEEAGVKGKIDQNPVGIYQNKKWNGTCIIKLFAYCIQEELPTWPEGSFRHRKWVKANKIKEFLDDSQIIKLAEKAEKILKTKLCD